MQLSEDRIDWIANVHCHGGTAYPSQVKSAIREALAEALRAQADARPVAWHDRATGNVYPLLGEGERYAAGVRQLEPLYTHPETSAQPMCVKCGDGIMAHDPGTCGNCHAMGAEASAPGLSGSELYDLMVEHCDGNGFQVEPEVLDSIANHIASTCAWQAKNEAAAEALTRASAATVAEPRKYPLAQGYQSYGDGGDCEQAEPSHPDGAAVDRFAAAMKQKLAQAREKGRGGWEQCDPVELSLMLREHVEKGDPRDVANFCMFLWNLGKPISDTALPYGKPAAQSGQRAGVAEKCAQFAELYRDEHACGREAEEACNEIARACREFAAQSGQRAGVAEGWRFYSADFSITAHQPSQPGYVMLIRDETGYKKWHRMDEAAKKEIPLFVTGRGVTFEKALLHANENAMLAAAAAPTQQQPLERADMSKYIRTEDRLPPDGEEVMCIDSGGYERTLKRKGNLWWFPDDSMYVYFVPVAWKPLPNPVHGESHE